MKRKRMSDWGEVVGEEALNASGYTGSSRSRYSSTPGLCAGRRRLPQTGEGQAKEGLCRKLAARTGQTQSGRYPV
jgi:hypothetical protein